MTPERDVLKFKKYCIIHNCKKLASFNYHDKKKFLYCGEHKLDKMVNIEKGYMLCEKHNVSYLKFCKQCEILSCQLCNLEKVNTDHFFSKQHINNFDKNITILTKTSIKKNLSI